MLFLLLPTGLLALRSPMLLLVTLPTFAWRFLSDRYTYWEPWYQYDAVLVPIAVAAMIEGAILMRGRVRQVGLALAVVATLALLPQQAFKQVWDADFWRTPARTAAVDRVLDKIPDGSRVAASDNLGSRIALRTDLYLIGDTSAPTDRPCRRRSSTRWSGSPWTSGRGYAAGAGLAGLRAAARERRVRGGRRGRRSRRRPPDRRRVASRPWTTRPAAPAWCTTSR